VATRPASAAARYEERAHLAVRVPKALRHALRLFCTEREVQMSDFIANAVREKLRHESR